MVTGLFVLWHPYFYHQPTPAWKSSLWQRPSFWLSFTALPLVFSSPYVASHWPLSSVLYSTLLSSLLSLSSDFCRDNSTPSVDPVEGIDLTSVSFSDYSQHGSAQLTLAINTQPYFPSICLTLSSPSYRLGALRVAREGAGSGACSTTWQCPPRAAWVRVRVGWETSPSPPQRGERSGHTWYLINELLSCD